MRLAVPLLPKRIISLEGAKTLTTSCPVESYQSSIAEAASWSFLDVGGKGAC